MEDSKKLEDMSPDELKEYEETLLKERKIRDLKKIQEGLDQEKATEKEDKETLEHEALKETLLQELYKEKPELAPKPKITQDGEKVTNGEPNKGQEYYNGYFERNPIVNSLSDQERKLDKGLEDVQFQVYKNGQWDVAKFGDLFENTDSDTGCEDDVSAWSPDDIYAKVVWNTFVCKADLFKLCVKGISINPGDGLGVQIRAYGAWGDPVERGSCECNSCASITYTTYPLTLKQYGMEGIVCEKDIWDVGGILMDAQINSMSDSWARWFDAQIYGELETASPGTTETLGTALNCDPSISGSCCTDTALTQLYHAVKSVKANMREGTGLAGPYKPDYLIISPTVGEIFGRMQTPTPILGFGDVKFNDDGELVKIAGLKVVEYCGANSCASTQGEVMAIIIDSRRAVGAVFGERPKMYKFFQTNCNSYRIDWWSFFAVGELDTDAIAHIVNP